MNKIPVIGAPVVRNPEWIRRQIESVDYPVENYIIFNNNGKGEIDEELDKLVAEPHKFIDQIRVCHLPANIGTSGAWNLIIKSFMLVYSYKYNLNNQIKNNVITIVKNP